jgi:predicted RNase H-like HicB family nuclease
MGTFMSTHISSVDLSPARLLVRCLVEQKGGQWQAFSLEFGLAAQGETETEAKAKLEAMIVTYVEDALIGEDREHAHELLRRQATWQVFIKYYSYRLLSYLAKYLRFTKKHIVYQQPMQLAPRHSAA